MKTKIGVTEIDFPDIEGMLVAKGYKAICGVDEVGRGPLAGPVVAAAVILPESFDIDGIDDSKCLPAEERDRLFQLMVEREIPCGIGIIDNKVIDQMNILRASLMAMRKAVLALKKTPPDFLLVDGNQHIPNIELPQFALVSGDGKCKAVAAASIMAKVTRDRIMEKYEALYRGFSFAQHKGYATEQHLMELREHGPCDIHRRSYRPVAEILERQYALL